MITNMFGLVEIKVEPLDADSASSDDEALVHYANIKKEASEQRGLANSSIKQEPEIKLEAERYSPDFGAFVATELAADGSGSDSDEADKGEGQESAKCDICGGVYRNKQGLSAHKKRIHFNKYLKESRRTGECVICHKKYVNRKSLQTHMNKMHLKNNGRGHQFKCEDCGKVFRIRNSLWMHRYSKHSNRDFRTPCEYCPKVLKSPRSHKDHLMKKHPREYVSREDSRPVAEAEAIARVRPHQCHLCEKRYTCRSALRKHVAAVHPAPALARDCPACGRQFKTEQRLLMHLEAAHSGPAELRKCAHCGLVYKNKYSLQHHTNYTHGVRVPLDWGEPVSEQEARLYTRKPHSAPLGDPLLAHAAPAQPLRPTAPESAGPLHPTAPLALQAAPESAISQDKPTGPLHPTAPSAAPPLGSQAAPAQTAVLRRPPLSAAPLHPSAPLAAQPESTAPPQPTFVKIEPESRFGELGGASPVKLEEGTRVKREACSPPPVTYDETIDTLFPVKCEEVQPEFILP